MIPMAISDHIGGRLLKISLCWALLVVLASTPRAVGAEPTTEAPTPKPWPDQFHSILMMNYTGILQIIDLWYDWPGGRNLNLIQKQLGSVLHDVEWNNGTSFFYTLNENGSGQCSLAQLEVGILRPNWLDGATYIGRRNVDGFLCNVWEKADFITYYEDVVTNRPVHWVFYTGREAHVMTFEVGAVLEDSKWQAPTYCFQGHKYFRKDSYMNSLSLFPASSSSINKALIRRGSSRSRAVL